MILCSDVYTLLLDEIRADKRGLSLSPDEFNRILKSVNKELYTDFVGSFEEDIESSDTMGWFKEFDYEISLTDGVGTLPDDYYQMIGKPRSLDGATYRRHDLVSSYELACREDDYLTQPSTTYPVYRIGGKDANDNLTIRINPITITTVWIDYLRCVDNPFLDYYTNNLTLEVIFLDETSVLQTIPLGSTYRDGTVGLVNNITSLTSNMVWDEEDLPLIMAKLRTKVGIQLPDQFLVETSAIDEAKSKA